MTDQMGFSHPLGYSGVFSVNIPANGRPEFVHLVALCPDQLGAVMVENSPLNEAQLQNPHSVNVSCNAPYMRGPYYAQRREGIYYSLTSPEMATPLIIPLNGVGVLEIEGGFASIAKTSLPKSDFVCQSNVLK